MTTRQRYMRGHSVYPSKANNYHRWTAPPVPLRGGARLERGKRGGAGMSNETALTVSVVIDPEFRALIPPLTAEEKAQLEQNILTDGCREPLTLWDDILLDGHNRYEICTRHNLPFGTTRVVLENREAAINWIINNQLGRRNLTPEQASYLRGKRYQAEKKEIGARGVEKLDQNDPTSTAEKLANEYKVSAPTIKRDGQFAAAVDTLAEIVGEDARQSILTRDTPFTKKDVLELAKEAQADPEAVRQKIEERQRPHVANNSGNNEWYTPAEYIEAARAVLGEIYLDPASSDIAQKTVKAKIYFTAEDDGLRYQWYGRTWMNPPYAADLIGKFTGKLVEHFAAGDIPEAIVLVNNATETSWFQSMLDYASAVCFVRRRIKFVDQNGNPSGAPLQGQAILYLGDDPARFTQHFAPFGAILYGHD